MLIVLATVLSAGLVVFGVFLFRRTAAGRKINEARHQSTTAGQRTLGSSPDQTSSRSADQQGSQETYHRSQGEPTHASEPIDVGQSTATTDSSERTQQLTSQVTVEDGLSDAEIESARESGSEMMIELVQPGQNIAHETEKHLLDDAGRSMEAGSDEPEKVPFTPLQNDTKVEGTDGGTAKDETVGEEADFEPAAPNEHLECAAPDCAAQEEPSSDTGTEADDKTSRDRNQPSVPEVSTPHMLPLQGGTPETEPLTDFEADSGSDIEIVSTVAGDKAQTTVFRDRRGNRRARGQKSRIAAAGSNPPAEARLRLLLNSVQRAASLSVVLTRREDFPERIHPLLDGKSRLVEAFDSSRYDDLDLPWTSNLLNSELRIRSTDGKQWLRAARAIHIFAESPAESGLISVGTARANIPHAIVCKTGDEETVRTAAESTGSTPLASCERWHGIPDGWVVLSEYRPRHAATAPLPAQLKPLDPGTAVDISLSGGLAIKSMTYAEGRPPRISIAPLPERASVTIGSVSAQQTPDGAWEAPDWDSPGHHLIDVVPGPSLTYQVLADPVANGGWQFWDAYPGRFGSGECEPWGRAEICGAAVRGPKGEMIIAEVSRPVLIALGERRHAVALTPRNGVPASVAMVSEAPAFLIAARGPRRKQGRVIWLGSLDKGATRISPDRHWADTVRSMAARRLPLDCADSDGQRAWRNAKKRARHVWRRR